MDTPGPTAPAGVPANPVAEARPYWGMDQGPVLRDVGCFALVARQLSFSRAATELGMSQPAVSQAIARLERALDLRLFERTSREVQLSDAGKVLLPHAEALLDQANTFATEANWLAMRSSTAIRLAYCPLVGALAARVARRLARRSPRIDLELRAATWSEATADLAEGVVAAAILSAPFPAGLATTARFHLPVSHVAVPADSPLGGTAPVRLDQVTRYEILLPRSRPPGSVWAQLATLVREANRARIAAADFEDLPAALDLVAADRGILPVPGLLVETTRRPDVRFLALDAGDLRMRYALAWRREPVSAEAMALVQAVQAVLRNPGPVPG